MKTISEKKLAANRANAKKSTGPKSFAAKKVSARNAEKHGLRSPRLPTIDEHGVIEKIAVALCDGENERELLFVARPLAREMARALEIRRARDDYIARLFEATWADKADLARMAEPGPPSAEVVIARFVAACAAKLRPLDLYERRRRRKLRVATKEFVNSLADLQFWVVEKRLLDDDFAAAMQAGLDGRHRRAPLHLPRRPSVVPPRPPTLPGGATRRKARAEG